MFKILEKGSTFGELKDMLGFYERNNLDKEFSHQ
jgi:hypothetical protein